MKTEDVKIGGEYFARVSGNIVKVRVDSSRERESYAGFNRNPRTRTVFSCTNLKTGRVVSKSAAALRSHP